MKLHSTTVEKLIKIFENYGGYREQTRLRAALQQLDLQTYDQQSTGKKVLVLSKELNKHRNEK